MGPNALIPQILSRSDVILYLWIALVVVGLAVLFAASRQGRHDWLGRVLVIGYGFFAFTHVLAIQWLLKQWAVLAMVLKESQAWKDASEAAKADLANILEAPEPLWVLPFHLAFDAFVLGGIWWLTRKRGL